MVHLGLVGLLLQQLVGLIIGLAKKRLKVNDGEFGKKESNNIQYISSNC